MKYTLALLASLLCVACGPKAEPQTSPRGRAAPAEERTARPAMAPPAKRAKPSPAPQPVGVLPSSGGKVNCQDMCTRTFIQCVGEVLVASGKISARKIAAIESVGAMHKVQQAGFKTCMTDCSRTKGFGSDAVEINKCLTHTHCMKYAQCIKKHIK